MDKATLSWAPNLLILFFFQQQLSVAPNPLMLNPATNDEPAVLYMRMKCFAASVLLLLLASASLEAATYSLSANQVVIGESRRVRVQGADTLMDVARAHNLGHWDIRLANPTVDIWIPGAAEVVLPNQYLLPQAPKEGIVLNRSEMRLYYYHPDATGQPAVTTYPVGIGRADRQTPLGRGQVVVKVENPAWYPTPQVRADHAARGQQLSAMVPPGPDNPLGDYAIILDLPGYMLHGTNRPDGIGMQVSQGCVRLYPEHIEALVYQVAKGTPVTIIDQPLKAGVQDGEVWVEVHPPVYGEMTEAFSEQQLISKIAALLDAHDEDIKAPIDWRLVTDAFRRADGIPTSVTSNKARHLHRAQR